MSGPAALAVKALLDEVNQLKIERPSKMRELSSTMKYLNDNSADRKVVRNYAVAIAQDYLQQDMASASNAMSGNVSVEFDESTDGMRAQQLVICASWVDEHKGLQRRVVNSVNVSKPGDTVGANLKTVVESTLKKAGLFDLIDWVATDGASNVCDYRTSGQENSAAALLVEEFRKLDVNLRSWWCILHRLNLAINDMLREVELAQTIKVIRMLIRWCRTSVKRSSAIADEVQKARAMVEDLEKRLLELDESIRDHLVADREDDAKAEQNTQDEVKRQRSRLEDILNNLGKRRCLHRYLCIRWISLFRCVDSLLALWPFIKQTLKNPPGKKSKKRRQAQRNVNDSDDGSELESDEDANVPDNKTDPKALLASARSCMYLLHFLRDLGRLYVPMTNELQTTSTTISHIAFDRLHSFMTKLFNTALKFPNEDDAKVHLPASLRVSFVSYHDHST